MVQALAKPAQVSVPHRIFVAASALSLTLLLGPHVAPILWLSLPFLKVHETGAAAKIIMGVSCCKFLANGYSVFLTRTCVGAKLMQSSLHGHPLVLRGRTHTAMLNFSFVVRMLLLRLNTNSFDFWSHCDGSLCRQTKGSQKQKTIRHHSLCP